VTPWVDCYFIVKATDLAGNETVDSNEGNCYRFTPDGPNDINVPGDYNSIQEAIDRSWDGGTVRVSTGTYYETINFKGKSITVTSTDPCDWDIVAATIIDANGAQYGVLLNSGEDANSELKGFTVKGATAVNGNGVKTYNSDTTISNCIVENNTNSGVYIDHGQPTVRNSIIRDNGAGISCVSTAATIINNWIYDNGDGLLIGDSGSTLIRNNTVANNETHGFCVVDAAPTITNCIIWDNYDDLYSIRCTVTVTYSCIKDCNYVGDANTTHNICDDPLFFDADANDFHLDTNSPCFNSGDPNGDYSGEKDIDGDDRVLDGHVDIGADEMTCLSRDDAHYDNWIYWGKPECWCYQRHCRGDSDGQKQGSYWVSENDFDKLQECFYKTEENLPEGCECADFDHQKLGPYWVSLSDLNILKEYFEESEPNVPTCEDCVKVNFWTN
jgi:parallel beta-helix repeat protein